MFVLVLLLVLAAGSASAQSAERVLAATLDNGLRVLLQEDHRSPIVSVSYTHLTLPTIYSV